MSTLTRTASGLGTTLAAGDTDERDHPSRGLVPLHCESRSLEARGHGVGREPQLAIKPLAEAPAARLPDPDEVVDFHGAGLVLEKTAHDELVVGTDRNHAIEVSQFSAEVAEREHEPTTGGESRSRALEDPGQIGLAFEMRERIAHADDKLDLLRHELGDVADVAGDRLDRQA